MSGEAPKNQSRPRIYPAANPPMVFVPAQQKEVSFVPATDSVATAEGSSTSSGLRQSGTDAKAIFQEMSRQATSFGRGLGYEAPPPSSLAFVGPRNPSRVVQPSTGSTVAPPPPMQPAAIREKRPRVGLAMYSHTNLASAHGSEAFSYLRLVQTPTKYFTAYLEPVRFGLFHCSVVPHHPNLRSVGDMMAYLRADPSARNELQSLLQILTTKYCDVRAVETALELYHKEVAPAVTGDDVVCPVRSLSADIDSLRRYFTTAQPPTTDSSTTTTPKRSIVLRCGFFLTQPHSNFDVCSLHIVSADALFASQRPLYWQYLFHDVHFIPVANLLAETAQAGPSTAAGPVAAINPMESMSGLLAARKSVVVAADAATVSCPVCKTTWPNLEQLRQHWASRCLRAMSLAGGGEPITL